MILKIYNVLFGFTIAYRKAKIGRRGPNYQMNQKTVSRAKLSFSDNVFLITSIFSAKVG